MREIAIQLVPALRSKSLMQWVSLLHRVLVKLFSVAWTHALSNSHAGLKVRKHRTYLPACKHLSWRAPELFQQSSHSGQLRTCTALTVLEKSSEACQAGSKFYKHGTVWIPLCQRPRYEVREVACTTRISVHFQGKKIKANLVMELRVWLFISSDSLSSRYFVRQRIWGFNTVCSLHLSIEVVVESSIRKRNGG